MTIQHTEVCFQARGKAKVKIVYPTEERKKKKKDKLTMSSFIKYAVLIRVSES